MNIPQSDLPRVIVVGGGFGGVTLSRKLTKQNFQVVLIDRHNYHNFQPLMYQVATSGLEPDSIAFPLRGLVEDRKNFLFRLGEVNSIDPDKKIVCSSIGDVSYDYLVIATGTKTNFFGNKDLEEASLQMKSVPQALNIRSYMLQNLEKATLTNDVEEQKKLMRIVLSGAGPTGVELAGAFAEFKKGVLKNDYPDLNPELMEIHLLDGSDRVLASMSKKASQKAEKYLRKLGVQIHLNVLVKNYENETVLTNTDLQIVAYTFIWSAGVIGNPIKGLREESVDERSQRFLVDKMNRVEGYEGIFAIGDIALMKTEEFPKGHPQVAQPAIQQGKLLVKNFKRLINNQPLKEFSYLDKGSMATIGRNKAVADVKNFTLGGFLAWITWLGVHLYFLVGVRNRLVVFLNWIYNYFNFDRAARVIIRPYQKKKINSKLK
ncbi:NADH dehydrogenase [Nonlabens xylanidelens]|uniref:NADH:ubiquinone reductase (non-electrogenic) n=1 Tax=Nonlabens xylanidelens TaxID=191564 RepID=A0A2S6IGH2_9FLAO|nr:NAD(P)/FAD-dependent oxidoreductase [Nonlabens xylanidelens]PPK93250.1 NADH dehydrogenase [Nonlabens xylanidelens]PQJ20925.1 FAD-dependent oxidoreductase [Nonlabens xylanidelens]